jgi:nucleoside-diphosphate-sugar epimerase
VTRGLLTEASDARRPSTASPRSCRREDAPPRPLPPYGVTKLAGEQPCRVYHVNHGHDTVALRFFTVYGPRQRPDMAFCRFCEAAARDSRIELFGGDSLRARVELGFAPATTLAEGLRAEYDWVCRRQDAAAPPLREASAGRAS